MIFGGERVSCQKCVELLRDFLDGDLPRDVQGALETHIGGCPTCQNFTNTYRSASGCAKRRLLADQVPPELQASVENFLKGKIPGF